jgi:hypothetical protein
VGEFMLMGVSEKWVTEHIHPETKVCFIYCRTIAEFIAVERQIEVIKQERQDISIVLFENIQSVTSYSLRNIADDFLKKGADCIIMGEPEDRVVEVTRRIEQQQSLADIPGLAFSGRSPRQQY